MVQYAEVAKNTKHPAMIPIFMKLLVPSVDAQSIQAFFNVSKKWFRTHMPHSGPVCPGLQPRGWVEVLVLVPKHAFKPNGHRYA